MKPNVRRYLISICVGIILVCAILLIRNIFAQTDVNEILIIFNDAFFISGMCLTCVGGLVFVSNKGMFHMLGYGISMLFNVRRWDINKRKYKDYYEYKEAKSAKQHSYAYLLIVGLAFIAVALILLIWIKY